MAIFHPFSFKGKLIAATVGMFAAFIWVLVFFSLTVVQRQFEQVLYDEQFASTQRLAAEIDNKLRERSHSLVGVAENLPSDLDSPALDSYLEKLKALHTLFSGGIAVIGLEGKAIADYPKMSERRSIYYGDRDYFRQVIASGKPYVGKPLIGRVLKRPILPIAVPVFDRTGNIRAVMTGVTDLAAPNFLGIISNPTMAGKGEFFLVSPRDSIIVTATDARKSLTMAPVPGVNLMYDRFSEGFDGSGITVGADGIQKLVSGKHMREADWIVMAALPTAIAFSPVRTMMIHLFIVAALMTLLSFFIIWWVTRRMLEPLEETGKAMREMTDGETPLAPLPVKRQDEIGQMIGNFNMLVRDRQRYEAALTESEQRFRLLVEGAPDAIVVQTNGYFSYVNAAALCLFGATSKEQLLRQTVLGRTHPDSRLTAEGRFNFLVQTGQANPPLEKKYLKMDGSQVEVEVSAVPFRFENQDGALVFMRDITERKRIERELREREEEFRALVEHSPDAIARYDSGFRCIYANPAVMVATGLQRDEIVGKAIEEMGFPQEFSAKWSASLKNTLQTGDANTFEFQFHVPNGTRYYQARMVPEFGLDGQVLNVLTVARDISVIKGGETVLRESEQRIHGITANMPGMVFQCQLRTRDGVLLFTYVSEGATLLLGLAPGEILNNRNAIVERLVEPDRWTFRSTLRNSALSMKVWNWEGRTLPVNGEEKWINCRATPRLADDGDIIWEGVMLNITESKRGEEEIMQSRQLLRELSAHMDKVREEERKRIAREVHDELGQALTVLRMDVSLLRLNFGGQSPQLMERIQSMKDVVDRTIQIMRHVTSTLRPVALDLGLTAALEWLVEEFIRHTGIDCRLHNDYCDDVVLDDARATALFRIVQESLTNVTKHAEASLVEILIETKNDDMLCLKIHDDGQGFILESSRKAGSFGLIGMRERTLMLQGELEIESAPGQGTRIEVCIPLKAQSTKFKLN